MIPTAAVVLAVALGALTVLFYGLSLRQIRRMPARVDSARKH